MKNIATVMIALGLCLFLYGNAEAQTSPGSAKKADDDSFRKLQNRLRELNSDILNKVPKTLRHQGFTKNFN
ncbi:MAG: hypothetical protein M1445_09860 [Bacteroidetes bacterium]|nr:hypothetical protein [Bacteroidota bacterium]MCL6102695.1 hypothetical protein [Bacteroidota bacterium]